LPAKNLIFVTQKKKEGKQQGDDVVDDDEFALISTQKQTKKINK